MAKRKAKKKSTKKNNTKISYTFSKKKLIATALSLLVGLVVYSRAEKPIAGWEYKAQYAEVCEAPPSVVHGELPEISDSTFFVHNADGQFSYHYNNKRVIADWVAYRLTREDVTTKEVNRTNYFKPDPEVLKRGWNSATTDDYYRSNYDRGHMVPSSDRDDSREENRATFLLSNIVPQAGRVNRGAWLMVETKVREWAYAYGEVYVVSGVIVNGKEKYIGENRVVIPSELYKCVAYSDKGTWRTKAFIIPNTQDVKDDYTRYETTVNKVERKAKINLFPHIEKLADKRFER